VRKLFIGALPFKYTEAMIRDLFKDFGKIGSVKIFADWESPVFEPHACIEIERDKEAILEMDGKKIGSTHIRVHEWR
jgi:hypothetical protein